VSDIELLKFQLRASRQIGNRYLKLLSDAQRPSVTKQWDVPLYQALSALTGAGKTPILADAVAQIRAMMPTQPIVLWISKAKAVVDQTFANFESGGKYNHLLESFIVEYLADLSPEELADDGTALLAIATVGSFNQRDKADGSLTIHQPTNEGDDSLWSLLQTRITLEGIRRPLIIVYDEGHNLSDQQTDLLLELEPDAILVASATMRTPGQLGKMIQRLKDSGWTDRPQEDTDTQVHSCLVTAVSSKAVVEAGLVKRQIVLGGYTSIMETMIDDLLETMAVVEQKSTLFGLSYRPKAIYVCKTNVNQDDGGLDSPARPFNERRAPPILIWRYLVYEKNVDPATIAVYCDLRLDRHDFPPPPDFKLFSGGDQDFATFSAGRYSHIIFNQSLQEGWDDPACCLAYIDKSMGSDVQVEQVIGRVLRQPGATHYADADLNTATFFIRVDNKQDFPRILKSVQAKLGSDIPEVRIDGFFGTGERQRERVEPKAMRSVPEIHIDASAAVEPLRCRISSLHDYRTDRVNTVGSGEIVRALQNIGDGSKPVIVSQQTAHSNRVTARWVVRREMRTLFPEATKAINWSDARFDARIEITSPAAVNLREDAAKLVETYLEHSELVFEDENLYSVGLMLVNPAKAKHYNNSLHDKYELNPFETTVAEAIDESGFEWVRNPQNGGFSIPLLDKGDTSRFFPDFLVWKDSFIIALDPKGGHLLTKDAGRKLLNIQNEKGQRRVLVRLISEGRWNDQLQHLGPSGYTVWIATKTTAKIKGRAAQNIQEAVHIALQA
jgi:type III restriction enzyme